MTSLGKMALALAGLAAAYIGGRMDLRVAITVGPRSSGPGTIAFYESAKEHTYERPVRFASLEVQQLAQYALRNVPPGQLEQRLKEMDATPDGTITEAEVLSYVRNH